MLITIIVLSVICANLLTIVILQYRTINGYAETFNTLRKDIHEFEHCTKESEIEIAAAKARRSAFAVAGDTMHRISRIIEGGTPRYAQVIEKLGEYARGMYRSLNVPLGDIARSEHNWEEYLFPELSTEQNSRLIEFLQGIVKKEIQPEALLELMENLLCGFEIEKAINCAEFNWKEKATQKN